MPTVDEKLLHTLHDRAVAVKSMEGIIAASGAVVDQELLWRAAAASTVVTDAFMAHMSETLMKSGDMEWRERALQNGATTWQTAVGRHTGEYYDFRCHVCLSPARGRCGAAPTPLCRATICTIETNSAIACR